MMSIPGPEAPEKVGKAISLYGARRFSFFSSLVPILLLIVPMLAFIPVEGTDPTTFKAWVGVGLVGFMFGWWVLVWGVPARRYREYLAQGHIIEIRDPQIIAFVKDYWKPFNQYLDNLRAAELRRFNGTLFDLAALALVEGDEWLNGSVQDRIAREEERLRQLMERSA
ncbi:MAG TPA: hypothetical protein VJM32_03950 [Candidatus Saccharimonadales bacterium]|nr:hypothetical protein [Candidatus Saccharimonadales bacterium]